MARVSGSPMPAPADRPEGSIARVPGSRVSGTRVSGSGRSSPRRRAAADRNATDRRTTSPRAVRSERTPTPLQRQLGEPENARPTPLDAFRLARRTVLNSQRLDMQALAAELGVNRVTLYRWVGSREQLLVEVLWSMTQWRFDEIWGQVADQPGSRVPEVLRRWVRLTIDAPGMRYLLYDQHDLAMRLLTLESGGFQPRLLALIRRLIDLDIADGRVASPLDPDDLAFAVLRICESYIYLPVILDHETDPDAMKRVLLVLLPAADTAAGNGGRF